jgi:hypothetical protein
MQTDRAAAEALEPGDTVGARLIFGVGEQTVFADCDLRHAKAVADNAYIGFRFIGLEQGEEGAAVLQLIASKIAEFQKASQGAVSRKA